MSRIALEFAESPLIPYNFRDFTRGLELFEQDLERYAEVQVEKVGRAKPVLHFDGLKRALNSLKLVSKTIRNGPANGNSLSMNLAAWSRPSIPC